MPPKRVFVSFDYDHDKDLKDLLVGQARNPDSPFEVADWSMKEPVPTNWEAVARDRIKRAEVVVVICGEHTDRASGVNTEVRITQQEKKPYFLLRGRSGKNCKKSPAAKEGDKMYEWTWDNLKRLVGGAPRS